MIGLGAILRQAAGAAAAEAERLRVGLVERRALALRAERLAEVTGLPAREVAHLLERLDPYAPTEDQVVAILTVWRRIGVDPVDTLAALYLSCPLPREPGEG
jgi:hypothetical protein